MVVNGVTNTLQVMINNKQVRVMKGSAGADLAIFASHLNVHAKSEFGDGVTYDTYVHV